MGNLTLQFRAQGVSLEDRQDLLGHRSSRITTHYSSAELQNLFDATNSVCDRQQSGVVLTVLQNANWRAASGNKKSAKQGRKLASRTLGPANIPQGVFGEN